MQQNLRNKTRFIYFKIINQSSQQDSPGPRIGSLRFNIPERDKHRQQKSPIGGALGLPPRPSSNRSRG